MQKIQTNLQTERISTKWTVLDIINWGENYFEKRGIDSPRLNIELLLCDLLNFSRLQLYLNYDKPLLETELKKLKEYIKRRTHYEPIQYITGYAYFRDLKFKVTPATLIPRPETEILVDLVIKYSDKFGSNPKILDIGTGSGCIAIALARAIPQAEILAIDHNSDALAIAGINSNEYHCKNICFRKMNILNEIPNDRFDIIVSNPPYLSLTDFSEAQPEIKYYERKDSLTDGYDGLTFYRRFAQIYPQLLSVNACFFLEIGYNQQSSIQKLFNSQQYELLFFRDFNDIIRYVVGLMNN